LSFLNFLSIHPHPLSSLLPSFYILLYLVVSPLFISFHACSFLPSVLPSFFTSFFLYPFASFYIPSYPVISYRILPSFSLC
jgi:hypothetical protein